MVHAATFLHMPVKPGEPAEVHLSPSFANAKAKRITVDKTEIFMLKSLDEIFQDQVRE